VAAAYAVWCAQRVVDRADFPVGKIETQETKLYRCFQWAEAAVRNHDVDHFGRGDPTVTEVCKPDFFSASQKGKSRTAMQKAVMVVDQAAPLSTAEPPPDFWTSAFEAIKAAWDVDRNREWIHSDFCFLKQQVDDGTVGDSIPSDVHEAREALNSRGRPRTC
jgi:hypothetical protein